jgi:hypothetical protein
MSETEPPRRRVPIRWLTLGEAVAVAAVLISGLGLYNSWNKSDAPTSAVPARKPSPLVLKASVERDGARLALAPLDADQAVQSQRILFPKPLALAPVETAGTPEVDRGWVATALVRARDAAGRPADSARQERLPLLIVTRFIEDGTEHEDRALYDLAYTVDRAFLTGSHVKLEGLAFVARVGSEADGQKRIDARAKLAPATK